MAVAAGVAWRHPRPWPGFDPSGHGPEYCRATPTDLHALGKPVLVDDQDAVGGRERRDKPAAPRRRASADTGWGPSSEGSGQGLPRQPAVLSASIQAVFARPADEEQSHR